MYYGSMPNRSVLNKYALFASEVQKVRRKKELTKSDLEIVEKARLFALLSSNHSWHVYRFLHGDTLDKEAIANETRNAINENWKDISEDEMHEVITSQISESTFSMLLMSMPLSQEERKRYQELLPRLKEEFANGMEPIKREEEA
ncbi:MAG: hypothetical protein QXT43_00030 [Candidatus Micrarchaeaceae archaeon]